MSFVDDVVATFESYSYETLIISPENPEQELSELYADLKKGAGSAVASGYIGFLIGLAEQFNSEIVWHNLTISYDFSANGDEPPSDTYLEMYVKTTEEELQVGYSGSRNIGIIPDSKHPKKAVEWFAKELALRLQFAAQDAGFDL